VKRKRGGGGPWRAFVSKHWGDVLDYSVLAERYRALSVADKKQYVEEGKRLSMEARHRQGPRVSQKSKTKRALAEILRERQVRALTQAASANGSGEPTVLVVPADGGDVSAFAQSMKRAKSHAAAQRAAKHRRILARSDKLGSFAQHQRRHVHDDLGAAGAGSDLCGLQTCGVPGFCDTIDVVLPSQEVANKALHQATSKGRKRGTELLEHVGDVWAAKHTVITQVSSLALPANLPSASMCYLAGVCLCSPEGKELRRLRNSWARQLLLPYFKPHTPGRKLLTVGSLILRVEALEALANDPSAPTLPCSMWWH